ncbi:CPBP family intramembrane glutamic endopeptidase, BDIM_20840 family [Parvularcula maris]|uniref:CPBP family intramembrane metalloprotease n=1 Tax=Parvularcula maris TaxID=2965077 RepID=A0A9X2L739_9PROT|nr:CPBP family intramembrane glutamic endopeptidase [Parvularcula maris]MCQ8184265.1 CPBP family intramembrane metalloprotease [Parvularcula maris]
MSQALADGLSTSALYAGFILVLGLLFGLTQRQSFKLPWLLAAAAFFFVSDMVLSRFYGLVPNPEWASWNWTGKGLSLALALAVTALPVIGFRRAGITFKQDKGSLWAWGVFAVLAVTLGYVALVDGYVEPDFETRLFQWTMPGLDEELVYRGVLLLMLNEALRGRMQILGAPMGWAAVITSLLFGLIHTVSFDNGALEYGLPVSQTIGAFILVWMREKTGSVVLPVLAHNYVNGIFLMI